MPHDRLSARPGACVVFGVVRLEGDRMSGWTVSQIESMTTADPPRGLLLRVFRDGDGIFVKDMTGLRYGWGKTLGEAVEMWANCVQDALDEQNAGGAYLAEVEAYRAALAKDAS